MAEAHPGNRNNSHTYRIKTVDGDVEELRGAELGLRRYQEAIILELKGQRYANVSEVPTPVLRSWPLTSVLSYWEV